MKNYGKFAAGLIAAWFLFALSASALDGFKNDANRVGLAVAIAAVAPILVFALWFASSEKFRQFALSLNPQLLNVPCAFVSDLSCDLHRPGKDLENCFRRDCAKQNRASALPSSQVRHDDGAEAKKYEGQGSRHWHFSHKSLAPRRVASIPSNETYSTAFPIIDRPTFRCMNSVVGF